MSTQVELMAKRLSIEPQDLHNIVMNTLMPTGRNVAPVTNEQFLSFMAVANEYQLNPMTKEIYAFPSNGGIQPIVSIDGWLKIINSHPNFDGMEFTDHLDDGKLMSITCKIFRKDRSHPTEVTEYLGECKKSTEPWNKWPARMLRHKATIQAARYAFGFSGIVDPDEGDRIKEATAPRSEKVVVEVAEYSQEAFDKNFPQWEKVINSGKKTAADVIAAIETKAPLSTMQRETINAVEQEHAA